MTCISLRCPLINFCKHYNFLIERGEKCETQQKIIDAVEKIKKERKK